MGGQRLSWHLQQTYGIRNHGGTYSSARDGRRVHYLPVWQSVLFINPHSKRSLLFLCSLFFSLLPSSEQPFYLCYIRESSKLPREYLRPIFKKSVQQKKRRKKKKRQKVKIYMWGIKISLEYFNMPWW